MKRAIVVLLALFVGQTQAQDSEWAGFDDRWYAGVSVGVARPGSNRMSDSSVLYYGAYLGRFYSPNFSLDLQIDAYPTEFEGVQLAGQGLDPTFAGEDFDIYGYGLTGRWHFGDQGNKHRPYGLVGLGIAEHDSFLDDGRDMYVSFGAGVQSKLGDNLRLRTQIEGRYDNDRDTRRFRNADSGFVDMIASIGLSYSFGAPPRPPQPRPTPPPAPAARPAPPPAPAPAPAPAPEPEVIFEFDATVLFAFDSAALRAAAEEELDDAAEVLRERDEIILIEVAGHTDDIGSADYNQDLSQRRAQAVADYLNGRGIARDRMRVVGFGESRPRVPNTSAENRQLNRRVVLSILERR